MRKFCFLCGEKTGKLVEGHCEECYGKEKQLAKIKDRYEIIVCPKCNKAKIKMKLKKLDIEKFLKSKIKINGRLKNISIEEVPKGHEVTVKGYLPKSKKLKTETYLVYVHLNKRTCEICSKMLSNYYVAILQIRFGGPDTRLKAETIYKQTCKELERIGRKDPMAFYRIEQKGRDLDFYIGSKSAARKTSQFLKRKHDAKLKYSYKLVTRKEGKDLYRNIILVRI